MTKTRGWILILLGAALLYSVVRYHVFGGVDPAHFPLFILNKAISLGSVFLFGAALIANRFPAIFGEATSNGGVARQFGQPGFALAAVHCGISVLILRPEYYPKFFLETGRLNLVGELSMLLGVLSFACFTLASLGPALDCKDQRQALARQAGLLGFLLVGAHVLIMGWSGWLKPADWHGALPPISLVAFLAVAAAVIVQALKPSRQQEAHREVALE